MTFTRLSDSAALSPAPIVVFGPFEVERPVNNITRRLLHSSVKRGTFVPADDRVGTFQLLYATHADAKTAATFFAAESLFTYDVADASLDTRFMVTGGSLRIAQNEPNWELTVPYEEMPA